MLVLVCRVCQRLVQKLITGVSEAARGDMRIPRHGDDDGDYTLNEHRGHDDLI